MTAISDSDFFSRLKNVIEQGWIPLPDRGSGAPGLKLEEMIGVDPNNRDGPDTGIWELKYHGGTAPLTLFHLTPKPKNVMHDMVRTHGWPDDKGRTSFRHTIWGTSSKNFRVANDSGRITVLYEGSENASGFEPPYWTHDSLINAFAYKLRRLALVRGRKRNGMVRYESARLHWEPNVTGLINAIERGIIAIDFDARTQTTGSGLRDHGTKFRIKIDDLCHLYSKNRRLDA